MTNASKSRKQYTCMACGETHESAWSDEDAEREALALWGHIPDADRMVICDDCFERGKADAMKRHHVGRTGN